MTDIKITTDNTAMLDIDIVDGYPVLLLSEQQNDDQRAAMCAVWAKGTVPGMLENGVDWYGLYTQSIDMITINNQMQTQVQNYVGTDGDTAYIPIVQRDGDGIHIATVRTK